MESKSNPDPTRSDAPDGLLPPFAVALGGLAGSNAHGAGCLQALLKSRHQPTLISCTSGQIYWVYFYLRALEEIDCEGVRDKFKRKQDELNPYHNAIVGLFKRELKPVSS